MSGDRIICPVHGQSDCSPLLNGCSLVNQLYMAREAAAAEQERGNRSTDDPE